MVFNSIGVAGIYLYKNSQRICDHPGSQMELSTFYPLDKQAGMIKFLQVQEHI
jgi:hypothetical protein